MNSSKRPEEETQLAEVEVVCPICKTLIETRSDEPEVYCNECGSIVMQLSISAGRFDERR